jgi:hypothetical protein
MGKGSDVSVSTAVKGVILAAAAIGALGGLFRGGAWLMGTAFVPTEVFAAHVQGESDARSKQTETILRIERLTAKWCERTSSDPRKDCE